MHILMPCMAYFVFWSSIVRGHQINPSSRLQATGQLSGGNPSRAKSGGKPDISGMSKIMPRISRPIADASALTLTNRPDYRGYRRIPVENRRLFSGKLDQDWPNKTTEPPPVDPDSETTAASTHAQVTERVNEPKTTRDKPDLLSRFWTVGTAKTVNDDASNFANYLLTFDENGIVRNNRLVSHKT